MTVSKEARWAKIHQEAIADFNKIQSALRDERLQCLQDRRFYSIAGAQWEGPLGDQFENKPRYEFNKVHLAVIRVINEYRNNRIDVQFMPKDGTPADELADTCAGLYRNDYKTCSGDEAVDNAFEEGVGGGFGAWRLRPVYEDEEDDENDKQTVVFEPIFDADSCVFFDLDAKRQDKADAKRCYVLTPYTHEDYKEEFDDDPATWPKIVHQNEFDWCTPALVWVCELYRVESVNDTALYFRGLDDEADDMKIMKSDLDEDPDKLDTLQATGFRLVREKKVQRKKVRKYLMSGGKMLEDCGYIPGRCIPIIPFYGKRWVVDGIERCMGHVRLAKDAQRLQNTLLSWLAEMAMRFDIEKPILTPEQIRGHAVMWAEDNIKKFPYLLANAITDENGNRLPPNQIQYTKAPNIPPAMAALAQIAGQALEDMLGNQQAGEEIQPNISGKAVELIQQRLDMQVFIYMSNLAKAVKRAGEVWLSMKKDLVVEDERRMKVINADGSAGSVVMNQLSMTEDGEQVTKNDLARASLDVDVDVGPSSTSRRAATVRAVTGLLQLGIQDPQTVQVLTAFAMMNLEGEGVQDIRDYFRKQLVQIGAVKPTEEEQKAMQAAAASQQPDPQSQYLQAAAEEADSKAALSRAKTVQTIADANLKTAQARHVGAMAAHEHAGTAIDIGDAAIRQAAGSLGITHQ
jgi:hypothetical protein